MFLVSEIAATPSKTAVFAPCFGPVLPSHLETSSRFTELPPDGTFASLTDGVGVGFDIGQSHAATREGAMIIYDSTEAGTRRYVIS